MTSTTPKPVLKSDALYLGDNGACFCGDCAGMTAKYSGRDISGQKVMRVSKDDAEAVRREEGIVIQCEGCGRKAA